MSGLLLRSLVGLELFAILSQVPAIVPDIAAILPPVAPILAQLTRGLDEDEPDHDDDGDSRERCDG